MSPFVLFPIERKQFLFQVREGLYTTGSYYFAKVATEVPKFAINTVRQTALHTTALLVSRSHPARVWIDLLLDDGSAPRSRPIPHLLGFLVFGHLGCLRLLLCCGWYEHPLSFVLVCPLLTLQRSSLILPLV